MRGAHAGDARVERMTRGQVMALAARTCGDNGRSAKKARHHARARRSPALRCDATCVLSLCRYPI